VHQGGQNPRRHCLHVTDRSTQQCQAAAQSNKRAAHQQPASMKRVLGLPQAEQSAPRTGSPLSHTQSCRFMRSGHQGYVLHCRGLTLCMLQVLSGCRKMQSRACATQEAAWHSRERLLIACLRVHWGAV
jgi:hypothetical protein